MKIVILDGYAENPGDLSWEWMNEYGEYTLYEFSKPEQVVERAKGCDILITNKTVLGRDVLSQLDKLKFIALLSTGYNVVDIEYAKERGIPVSNIPSYSTNAVAQMTFALLLELCSKVGIHNNAVHSGEWSKCRDFCFWLEPLTELAGKTFGIIGYGKIGKAVLNIARAFGMKLAAYTPHPPLNDESDIEFMSLSELLESSDVISLHCPLTPKTEKMANYDLFKKMKKTAYFINTSRGAAVDEDALRKALDKGEIAGAGIDVLCVEPPKSDNPLLGCKKCVITPHIAWAAFETRERLMGICKENIASFLCGKPQNVVNP